MRHRRVNEKSKATGGEEGCGDERVGNPLAAISFSFKKTCRQDGNLQSTESPCRGTRYLFWPTYQNSIDVLGMRLWKLCFINLTAPSKEP